MRQGLFVMFVVRVIGVLALIGLNGFFAAAEFSLVAVRISRVRQLVTKGNPRARVVELLAICAGSFPVCSSALHFPVWPLAPLAKPHGQIVSAGLAGHARAHSALIAHALALTLAFALLSSLHVVIGELVPKTISLARAERVALLIAVPFHCF